MTTLILSRRSVGSEHKRRRARSLSVQSIDLDTPSPGTPSKDGHDANAMRVTPLHERLNDLSRLISSDLDLIRIVQTVTDVATEECGARFGAFFYNVRDEQGESYKLYTLSGAPRAAFESFGVPRNTAVFAPTFHGEAAVRSDDIRADPRYGKNAPYHGMPEGHLPVVSYLAVPVVSRSREVLGGLFFGHEERGVFSADHEALVSGIAAHAAVAIDNARLHQAAQREIERRKQAEEGLELLLGEVKHRYKNAVATIGAIAAQTFHSADEKSHRAFAARLSALGKALDLLTTRDWDRAPIPDIIGRALSPFDHENRFELDGPEQASLSSDNALILALVLHELATNAAKYGALSNATGRVKISWQAIEGDRSRIRICWRERGGPPVSPPQRAGFGTMLIERALGGPQRGAEIGYEPDGVSCAFDIPI
jgi:two-component sensor histidine kinase